MGRSWGPAPPSGNLSMPEFLVKVADERGQVLHQVENAPTMEEVRNRYAQQGYLVYSVKPRGMLGGGDMALPRRRRIKLDQFVVFNQQFVTLIRAGLPILMALDLLAKRQRNPYFKTVLDNVRARVKSGEALSQAFEAQGMVSKIYTTTLLAGERSGNLEEVLNRYITFERVALSLRKRLMASLVYPALLIFLVIVMLSFLMVYVVPEFAKLYTDMQQQLPPITEFMLALGLAARKYSLFVVVGLLAALYGLWRWSRTESGGERLDRIQLALPMLGETWLKYQVAMFARMMATLLSGGLPLVQALETAGHSMSSRHIAKGVLSAAQRVREGLPLSRSMEEAGVFPELAVEMTEVGESTGALPQMLTSVAEFYEEDVQTTLAAALSLIEPLILLVVAVVVGFVLISLYMPIFSLGAAGAIR